MLAFVVAHVEHALDGNEIRAFLTEHLPYYMIPANIIQLSALPMNQNGKIDRRALTNSASTWISKVMQEGYVAPATPTEVALAEFWSQLLNVKYIGAFDNFFALGGHSLLGTQVLAYIAHTWHVDLPLHLLFEKGTIHELAEAIEQARTEDAASQQTIISVSRDAYRVKRSTLSKQKQR